MHDSFAHVTGYLATGLRDVTTDLAALDGEGWWAVVADYEGKVTCARFGDVRRAPLPAPRGPWRGPHRSAWRSSLDRDAYEDGVRRIRAYIERGDVYQANLCRVLSAPLPEGTEPDPRALAARLAEGNPAPYAATVSLPGLGVVSASPELYLSRDGDVVESRPIKGTGATVADLMEKDYAENVMIVDLVRNDLGRVAEVGSVSVPALCEVEEHPGLVHLVSTVRARLAPGAGWPELFAATFPPGSVTGAPKSSALRIIDELEPEPRGPYCGAVGWVDADRRRASLAVGIRTFWFSCGEIRFGTGAGITWGSDPRREWHETELKASRLITLASTSGSEGVT
ncbi:para-aminobenzoate synthetase component 1 [Streptosporangium becharense]|uniref:Para-aminobenzoate synthetase component 1 n=1 Tax=Streptosporangium becharense TaxID=1816182 RepID=A0A7W9MF95_9ACTN|nr:chorismate-binding protein [Streptosporangium becharense]MBB2915049.1 para-aminobenzoate synthetase component 1 [Streptosporangium becharense]MBB5818098.1 para-aminobenzoate synthetase component 1 [Streptosporangium becharense]